MKTYAIPATLSTFDVLGLCRDVLRRAARRRLRGRLAEALAEVEATRDALDAAQRARGPEDDPLGVDVLSRMRAARTGVSALGNVLRGFAQLPEGEPAGDEARALHGLVFGGRTGFLRKGSVAALDEQTGHVLARATEKAVAARLAALGCEPVLRFAVRAHRALRDARGDLVDALDVTKVEGPTVGEARADALGALRRYVDVVRAAAKVEGSTLDDELLAPVRALRAPKRAVIDEEGDDDAPPSRAA